MIFLCVFEYKNTKKIEWSVEKRGNDLKKFVTLHLV